MNKVEELFKELGYRKEYPMEDWYNTRIENLEKENAYLKDELSSTLLNCSIEKDNFNKEFFFRIGFKDFSTLSCEQLMKLIVRELAKIIRRE